MRPGIIAALLKKDYKYLMKDKTLIPFGLMAIGLSWIVTLLLADPGDLTHKKSFFDFMGILFSVCGLGTVTLGCHVGEENWTKTARSLMEAGISPAELFLSKIIANYTYVQIVSLIILISKGYSIYQIAVVTFLSTMTYIPMCISGLILGILARDMVHANALSPAPLMLFVLFPLYGFMSEVKIIQIIGRLTPGGSLLSLINSVLNMNFEESAIFHDFMSSDLFSYLILLFYTAGLGAAFYLIYRHKTKDKSSGFYIVLR